MRDQASADELIHGGILSKGTSRRDFIKAALATPLVSSTAFAETAAPDSGSHPPPSEENELPHRTLTD